MRLSEVGLGVVSGDKVDLFQLESVGVSRDYLGWMQDPVVCQYLEARFEQHRMESLARFVTDWVASPNALLLGIRRRDEQRHIGNVKVEWNIHHGIGAIGILIGDRGSWGRGFASEAIALMCKVVFCNLGLRILICGMYDVNKASLGAFLRNGFEVEARLKQQALSGGEPVDVMRLRLLRRDYVRPPAR